jgi:hypothetical protein
MTKICYDKDLLQEVCDRDKCIIDFDKIKSDCEAFLNRKTDIGQL